MRGYSAAGFSAAGFSAGLVFAFGVSLAAASLFWGPLAPPFAPGDLLPYQDEYSNELRNSLSSPQALQRPLLTAPFGGSITQW